MSDRRLRVAIGALALCGLGVAGYLTWVHYAELAPVCAGGGCERVQASHYAELAGVPVALLGLIGYSAILASLALPADLSRGVTAGLTLTGAAFSLYLTYLELFVIDAICVWCVGSAVLMIALAALATARALASGGAPGAG